jgi:hypothetical protein
VDALTTTVTFRADRQPANADKHVRATDPPELPPDRLPRGPSKRESRRDRGFGSLRLRQVHGGLRLTIRLRVHHEDRSILVEEVPASGRTAPRRPVLHQRVRIPPRHHQEPVPPRHVRRDRLDRFSEDPDGSPRLRLRRRPLPHPARQLLGQRARPRPQVHRDVVRQQAAGDVQLPEVAPRRDVGSTRESSPSSCSAS